METRKELSPEQREALLWTLEARFEKNMNRHQGLEWAEVQARLAANPEKLWSLDEMERTGGEPDVVGHDKKTGEYIFYDCSAESPKGRRNVCYDGEGQEEREKKEHEKEEKAPGERQPWPWSWFLLDVLDEVAAVLLVERGYGSLL